MASSNGLPAATADGQQTGDANGLQTTFGQPLEPRAPDGRAWGRPIHGRPGAFHGLDENGQPCVPPPPPMSLAEAQGFTTIPLPTAGGDGQPGSPRTDCSDSTSAWSVVGRPAGEVGSTDGLLTLPDSRPAVPTLDLSSMGAGAAIAKAAGYPVCPSSGLPIKAAPPCRVADCRQATDSR